MSRLSEPLTSRGRLAPTPAEHRAAGAQPPPSRTAGWVVPLAVLAVVLLAAALRFWRLGHANLWMDEVVGVMLARQPVAEILDNVRRSPHGPGYYLLLKGWMGLLGSSAAAARALSAVAGVAVVLLVSRVGAGLTAPRPAASSALRDDTARHGALGLGVLAALLTALSPTQLYFSQEARFHMVATAFAVAALGGYLRWRARAVRALAGDASALAESVRLDDLLCFVLPTTLALYSYLLAALPLAACWIDVALLIASRAPDRATRRRVARQWLLLQGVVVLCCVPLALGRVVGVASSTQSWRTALGVQGAASDLVYYPVHQFHSRFGWWNDMGDKWATFQHGERWRSGLAPSLRIASFPATCLVVALALALSLRDSWRTAWRALWLVLLVPLVAEAAISSRQSLELSRYALFAAPPLFLLVARGLLVLPRPATAAALGVLVATMALGISGYWRVGVRDTDYRLVADLLARAARPGDSVVVSPSYLAPVVSYHVPALDFEVRDQVGFGWSAGAFPTRRAATGDWWLVLDYRSDRLFHTPAESIPAAGAFAGTRLRVVMDSTLPSSIRVLKLTPSAPP